MKLEYRYCNRCHRPIEPRENTDTYDICIYCAAELLNKIFDEEDSKDV